MPDIKDFVLLLRDRNKIDAVERLSLKWLNDINVVCNAVISTRQIAEPTITIK